jgi:hypothetical protein
MKGVSVMRLSDRRSVLIGVAVAALAIAAFGCSDSNNNVTSPPMGNSSVNVSGDWTGTYRSDTPSLCAGSPASASFTQQGTRVMGAFSASACGINGSFHGGVSGNTLTGKVDISGCTGGSVTGTITESGIQLQVSEFHKDLSAGSPHGPADVMAGGNVSLSR